MPAASTAKLSVRVLDFEDKRLLIQLDCLICDFCSSSQRFACGFLQIPPRDGHPCRPASDSPCRVRRRLSLPSKSTLPGAHKKRAARNERPLVNADDGLKLRHMHFSPLIRRHTTTQTSTHLISFTSGSKLTGWCSHH